MSDSGANDRLNRIDAIVRRMGTNVALICGVALIILALMIDLDVFLRAVFNRPLTAAVEASAMLLPWVVFPAFAYALIVGAHVRVTLFVERLRPRAQSGALIFSTTVGLVLFALVTYLGWIHFWDSFVIREVMLAQVPLPWWVGKLAFPVGMFFIAILFLIMLAQKVARPSTKKRKKRE